MDMAAEKLPAARYLVQRIVEISLREMHYGVVLCTVELFSRPSSQFVVSLL